MCTFCKYIEWCFNICLLYCDSFNKRIRRSSLNKNNGIHSYHFRQRKQRKPFQYFSYQRQPKLISSFHLFDHWASFFFTHRLHLRGVWCGPVRIAWKSFTAQGWLMCHPKRACIEGYWQERADNKIFLVFLLLQLSANHFSLNRCLLF